MSVESSAAQEVVESVKKPVILIVDDSRVMRLALKRILKEDYTVVEAVNGEDGWAKLCADRSVRAVFSDLSMPELNGFGLLERIRHSDDSRICALPFIVITGNEDDEGVRKEALSSGANDFIVKPFQSAEILSRAESYAQGTTAAGDGSAPVDMSPGLAAGQGSLADAAVGTPGVSEVAAETRVPAEGDGDTRDIALVEALAARQQAEAALERFKAEAEAVQRQMEATAGERLREALVAREDVEQSLEKVRAQLEEEGLRLHAETKVRQETEKANAVLSAQVEELRAEVAKQSALLKKESHSRRAAEQELARIRLQEVAQREAEQKAAAEAEKRRRAGLLGALRRMVGSSKKPTAG